MSPFFALDGVACTTKTSMLKKFEELPNFSVHYCDYKEISERYKLTTSLSGMMYGMHRMRSDETSAVDGHHNVFDRQPASALLYQCIFNNCDDEELQKNFDTIEALKLSRNYKSIIMLIEPGQESLVVDMMRRRNNGIDIMTEEYVRRQNHVFRAWARFNNYVTFTIDFKKNLNAQQDELFEIILNVFE